MPGPRSKVNSYRIYEVTAANAAQGQALLKLSQQGYDFLSLSRLLAHPSRLIVSAEQLSGFEELVKGQQMTYQLINADLGATIAEEFAQRQMQRRLLPITGKGRLTNDRYYTHEEIINYINDLAARYPSIHTVKTVGFSYEQR